jgi:tetratricopeptide (TPR) repeat protein
VSAREPRTGSAPPSESGATGWDARVASLLDEYLEAARRGEPPDRERFVSDHPEVGEALREALVALDFVGPAGAQGAPAPDGSGDRRLGGFRILREVGRGGMGVVYEAEDLSLHRRVALKVLPVAGPAGVVDEKDVRRFRHEAEVASRLQHAGIVPVLTAGREGAVHYYAMPFIDGPSLAGVIDALRGEAGIAAPAPARAPSTGTLRGPHKSADFVRDAARLGCEAAEALEHAHAIGVVHRDVKPGNLLLDGSGHLWVTDFGLARGREDTALTRTGDLVGTLRYMSPEQATANRDAVDARTDVYSLGATLYELTTLEPAVPGDDPREVLRRIVDRDPKPPRAWNPAIPAPLETILLKALAKAPSDRYATAGEMAADLRRFLEDRPVLARRASLAQRGARWARRHRGLVASAFVVLCLAVAGLTVATVRISEERERAEDRTAQSERDYQRARAAVDQMLTRVAEGDLADVPQAEGVRRDLLERAGEFYEALLEDRRGRAVARADAADAHHRLGAVHRLLGRLDLAERDLRRAIGLRDALRGGAGAPPAVDRALLGDVHDLGAVLLEQGRLEEASSEWERAVAIGERLVARNGADPEWSVALCKALCGRAQVANTVGALSVAEVSLRRAIDLASRADPSGAEAWAAEAALSAILPLRDRDEEAGPFLDHAEGVVRRLVAEQPASRERREALASMLWHRARHEASLGSVRAAEPYAREAVEVLGRLVEEFPSVPRHRRDLGIARSKLAEICGRLGRVAEATTLAADAVAATGSPPRGEEPSFADRVAFVGTLAGLGREPATGRASRSGVEALKASLAETRRLRARQPASRDLADQEAHVLGLLASAAQRAGAWAEAEQGHREALDVYRALEARCPEVPGYGGDVAACLQNLAIAVETQGRPPEALAAFEEAASRLEARVRVHGRVPRDRAALATVLGNLAVLRAKGTDATETERTYVAAEEAWRALARDFPQDPAYEAEVADAERATAVFLLEHGERGRAASRLESASARRASLRERFPEVLEHRDEEGRARYLLGRTLHQQGDAAGAEREVLAAAGLFRDLAEGRPEDLVPRRALGDAHGLLAEVRASTGREKDAEGDLRLAIAVREEVARTTSQARDRDVLGFSWARLGRLHYDGGRAEQAVEPLRRACEIDAALAADFPEEPRYRLVLASTLENLSLAHSACGRTEEAAAPLRQVVAIRAAIPPGAPGARVEEVRWTRWQLVTVLRQGGKSADARAAARAWVEAAKDDPCARQVLAWALGSPSDATVADAEAAEAEATRAVEGAPDDGGGHRALGVARLRRGAFAGARAALDEAARLGMEDEGLYFLAIACARAGDPDAARAAMAKADAWVARAMPGTTPSLARAEVDRFRAEAVAALAAGR